MAASAAPDPIPRAVDWHRQAVRLVDQRALPGRLLRRSYRSVPMLVDAIRAMVVRGAPSLGATAAYGIALAARRGTGADVEAAASALSGARPTAVNLAGGVATALDGWGSGGPAGALAAAHALADAEVERNRRMGAHGAELLGSDATVVTHCNTGGLAAVGYGTALGVVRAAHESGLRPRVLVDETRPLLQGARLTAWELARLEIPGEIIVDGAAASLMAAGEVDAVLVGADRIAANGDTANKIGTYALALAADRHEVPFYVVAPSTTIDAAIATCDEIVIEERAGSEVTTFAGTMSAPPGFRARNPAFDVTPAELITAIITEHGAARPPIHLSR